MKQPLCTGCSSTAIVVVDHQTDILSHPYDAYYCAECWGPFGYGAPGQNWEPFEAADAARLR